MFLKLYSFWWLRILVKSSGVQEIQFPQFSYNNLIYFSGSHSTQVIHTRLYLQPSPSLDVRVLEASASAREGGTPGFLESSSRHFGPQACPPWMVLRCCYRVCKPPSDWQYPCSFLTGPGLPQNQSTFSDNHWSWKTVKLLRLHLPGNNLQPLIF